MVGIDPKDNYSQTNLTREVGNRQESFAMLLLEDTRAWQKYIGN
jgi:hypothetical protein